MTLFYIAMAAFGLGGYLGIQVGKNQANQELRKPKQEHKSC